MKNPTLAIGATYARWLVVGYGARGEYLVQCPECPKQLARTKTQMERTRRCASCAKPSRHRGAVCS
jgi:endogenous inhibitor of DNA gyrase (YacG/DUF329 family)